MTKNDDKASGMKSAYELAMERLAADDGERTPLTEEQKQEIADIDSNAKAKIAEIEIMHEQKQAVAVASGDHETLLAQVREKAVDIKKIEEKAESKKEAIRTSGSPD